MGCLEAKSCVGPQLAHLSFVAFNAGLARRIPGFSDPCPIVCCAPARGRNFFIAQPLLFHSQRLFAGARALPQFPTCLDSLKGDFARSTISIRHCGSGACQLGVLLTEPQLSTVAPFGSPSWAAPGLPPGAHVASPDAAFWPRLAARRRVPAGCSLVGLDAMLPGMHRDAIMQRGGRDIETIGKRMCKGQPRCNRGAHMWRSR